MRKPHLYFYNGLWWCSYPRDVDYRRCFGKTMLEAWNMWQFCDRWIINPRRLLKRYNETVDRLDKLVDPLHDVDPALRDTYETNDR